MLDFCFVTESTDKISRTVELSLVQLGTPHALVQLISQFWETNEAVVVKKPRQNLTALNHVEAYFEQVSFVRK